MHRRYKIETIPFCTNCKYKLGEKFKPWLSGRGPASSAFAPASSSFFLTTSTGATRSFLEPRRLATSPSPCNDSSRSSTIDFQRADLKGNTAHDSAFSFPSFLSFFFFQRTTRAHKMTHEGCAQSNKYSLSRASMQQCPDRAGTGPRRHQRPWDSCGQVGKRNEHNRGPVL